MRKMLLFLIVLSTTLSAQYWQRVDSVFSPAGLIYPSFTCPHFTDLDGDGFYDLLLGSIGDKTLFFRNKGLTGEPKFEEDESVLASIYEGGIAGTNADYPATADLDSDGDQDLIIGGYNGLLYYINTGDASTPKWEEDVELLKEINEVIGTDPNRRLSISMATATLIFLSEPENPLQEALNRELFSPTATPEREIRQRLRKICHLWPASPTRD